AVPTTAYVYTHSLHDALPILTDAVFLHREAVVDLRHVAERALHRVHRHRLSVRLGEVEGDAGDLRHRFGGRGKVAVLVLEEAERSEEHTSELQSREKIVCRLM